MLDLDIFIKKLLGYRDINCTSVEKVVVCMARERETFIFKHVVSDCIEGRAKHYKL